ncbi:MAG: response regulator transcription factor [Bacteroidetes bacterium]|nr:response regulator transcription factor [Bacteroidota bacterium]MCB0843081.1 response regulator transcription factor [Bacteroidota bacterium]MCB0852686.1 response regulator transcription factor [Bacteroidota bacterium]
MRILIIEDESGIANFVKQGLEEEAYSVDVANNGTVGLDWALANDYDLLLVDWMLPGKPGIDIVKEFRQEKGNTPVIFLTAKDTVQDTVEGLRAGANDYIKKPFHFEELLERIKVQLRPKSGEHSTFTLGDIVLDISAHQVWRNEEEIFLTQKEFALFEFLVRNKGTVCRRTRIIESVWDIHFDYDTGIIDVYINAIRKKLKLTKDENYIQTVRGVGYIAKDL